MEFLNIGGGELLVIALLALILFGPEDLAKMMRKIGEFARRTQQMWRQLSATVQEELDVSELEEAVAEVKATTVEVQETLKEIGTSVQEVSAELERNVSEAQRELEVQADESAAALKKATTEQVPTDEASSAISDLSDAVTEAQETLAQALDAESSGEPTGHGDDRALKDAQPSGSEDSVNATEVSAPRTIAQQQPNDSATPKSSGGVHGLTMETNAPSGQESDTPYPQGEPKREFDAITPTSSSESKHDDVIGTDTP